MGVQLDIQPKEPGRWPEPPLAHLLDAAAPPAEPIDGDGQTTRAAPFSG